MSLHHESLDNFWGKTSSSTVFIFSLYVFYIYSLQIVNVTIVSSVECCCFVLVDNSDLKKSWRNDLES